MRRHPGRRKTDKDYTALSFAQLMAGHGGVLTAAELFQVLDGMTRAREALDVVLVPRGTPAAL